MIILGILFCWFAADVFALLAFRFIANLNNNIQC